MNLEDKLKEYLYTAKSPFYSFKDLSSLLSSNRQDIAKALIKLKNINELQFEIITEDTFRIIEIDGNAPEVTEVSESIPTPKTKGLFDREGNIFVQPHEFLNSTTSYQAKKYDIEQFKDLQQLKGREYDEKVLEIAHENLRLIVRKVYPLTHEATSEELKIMYKHVLMALCRAVEKHEYERGNTFSTYAMTWITSGLGRARIYIVFGRCEKRFGGYKPTFQLVSERYALLNKESDEYPKLDQVVESFKSEAEIWHIEQQKRAEKKEKETERLTGVNILFRQLVEDSEALPTQEQIELIVESIKKFDEKEKGILVKRYGLYGDFKNRQATYESIAENYNLTRERIRQIINLSLENLKVSWDSSTKYESFLKCSWESILLNMKFLDTRKSRLANPIGRIDEVEINKIIDQLKDNQIINFNDYVNLSFENRKKIQSEIGENLEWVLNKCLTFLENSELLQIDAFKDEYLKLPINALFIEWEVEQVLLNSELSIIGDVESYSHKIDDPVFPLIFENLIRLGLNRNSILPLSEFSQRTRNVFIENKIFTLEQLTSHSKQSLLSLNSFGTTSLIEVLNYLDRLGLFLGSHLKDIDGNDLINFDSLSERTKNCLKNEEIFTISQLESFTAEDLLYITNFGQQSLIDVENYLAKFGKKLKISEEISKFTSFKPKNSGTKKNNLKNASSKYWLKFYDELSPKKEKELSLDSIDISRDLLIFPAGNKTALKNFEKTVDLFYENREIQNFVVNTNVSIFSQIDDTFGYWGVNTSVYVMKKITTPCYGLFFKEKKGFKLVEIESKFTDPKLSSVFWEKISDDAFKFMFQIKSTLDINLEQNEFNKLVGWKENMVCRMFTHLSYPKSYMVLNYLKNQ